jgi:hypothetical protein
MKFVWRHNLNLCPRNRFRYTRNIFTPAPGIETEVLFEFSPTPGAPPKMTIEGITFIPNIDKLILLPRDLEEESLNNVEQRAAAIIGILPHTPIKGFGENIQFVEEEPTADQIALFNIEDDFTDRFENPVQISSTSIRRSVELEGCILNITSTLASNDSIVMDFNFHYSVDNAEEATQRLNETYYNNMSQAVGIIESYGFTYGNN